MCLFAGGVIFSREILMAQYDVLQLAGYFIVLLVLAQPLGVYMARVYERQPIILDRVLAPVENFLYRLCGVQPEQDMRWQDYALALLCFNGLGIIVVFAVQMLQAQLMLSQNQLVLVITLDQFQSLVKWRKWKTLQMSQVLVIWTLLS
jgi:K+-transporting ATPase ATPase A chain